jgi:phosphatidylglycerophosphate synthase
LGPGARFAGNLSGCSPVSAIVAVNAKLWPNLLSGLRIALMPAVLTAAMAGSRPWFLLLLGASLSTDALDGFLARKLNAFSEFGRKLDSAADYLTMITGLAGIAMLWPAIVHREILWISAGLTAFFGVVAGGFVRLGRAPCYHTWATKAGVIGCALSMVPLLTQTAAWPFHAMIVLLIAAAVEELAIMWLIPKHVGEMPTLWHARRERRRLEAATTAAVAPVEVTPR